MERTAETLSTAVSPENFQLLESSGIPAGFLRKTLSTGLYPGRRRELAASIIYYTGMRHAELSRLSQDYLFPGGYVIIPGVKKGRGKSYNLPTAIITAIQSYSEKLPFKESPSYQSLYKWIKRNEMTEFFFTTDKKRSIINTLRKKRIRELVKCGEPIEQIRRLYGWKSKTAIAYYL